jgi:phosphatidylserine/phosphatidylglycerophosphate/cardiolipin synthase-like enzyme
MVFGIATCRQAVPRSPAATATGRPGLLARGATLMAVVLPAVLLLGCNTVSPQRLPPGVYVQGSIQPACDARFLGDMTFVDATGARQSDQSIFTDVLRLVADAQSIVVADMFLYNEWGTAGSVAARPLTREFTEALLAKKQQRPECLILLITDPINTAYGGARADHLERLQQAGIIVVETDLSALRDGSGLYALLWRLLVEPFGNSPGGLLPNPMGAGRVSFRTYLSLLNFKANHRKVVIADPGGVLTAVVTSANIHDGSSAHSNIAVRFGGPAVLELLGSELAAAAFSGTKVELAVPESAVSTCPATVTAQVVTERAIKEAVLDALGRAGFGDEVDLVMFYLADRQIIRALIAAHRRGARLRLVLDPNKDAFGSQKNGIPNRQVARGLQAAGVPLRWYDTHGEQCHAKMLLVRYDDGQATLIAGSANYTWRNLDNINLESNVVLRGPATEPIMQDARHYVDTIWENRDGRFCTVDYERYSDSSPFRRWQFLLMDWTGIGPF